MEDTRFSRAGRLIKDFSIPECSCGRCKLLRDPNAVIYFVKMTTSESDTPLYYGYETAAGARVFDGRFLVCMNAPEYFIKWCDEDGPKESLLQFI